MPIGIGLGLSPELLSDAASVVVYLLRDEFTTDRAAGSVIGTAAEPGPGTRGGSDVESVAKIVASRLRGLAQATPVWGESKIYPFGTTSVARSVGRVMVALISPEDANSDIAIGFDTATTTTDPRTVGHGWLLENGDIEIITPGQKIIHDNSTRAIRPMQYFIVIALEASGAYVLCSSIGNDSGTGMYNQVGIPQFPSARLLWIDVDDTTSTLYPYVSAYDRLNYPDGHMVDDVRVLDIPDWSAADYLAAVFDRFTRADSSTSLGGDWIANIGTWGISSNQAYVVGTSNFMTASIDTGIADGIFEWDLKVPSDWTGSGQIWGVTLRQQDANNYLRLFNDGANNIQFQIWSGGGYGGTIAATGYTWTAGQTYRITCYAYSNKYLILIDGASPFGNYVWYTDSGSNFTSATQIGLLSHVGAGTGLRWDNVRAYPHTITLPSELQAGTSPDVLTSGSTLANDTFTDSNGTRLNAHTADSGGAWTEHTGTWTVSSNRATVSAAAGANFVTQDVSQDDVECRVEVITPGAFATDTIRAGIVGRYVDASNFIHIRLFMDAAQAGSDEVEILETIGGSGAVVHKVNIANYFVAATTYTLKAQFYSDRVHIFLDGYPRITYYFQDGSPVGTKFGLYRENTDDGCVFDNWQVKAI